MENLAIKAALQIWDLQISRMGKILDQLNGDDFFKEIAPGRNRVIYVVGHLIAVDDAMSEILGTGKSSYPEFKEVFLTNPDKSGLEMPTGDQLKTYWTLVHDRLRKEFLSLSDAEWLSRHTAMTDEDFAKDPNRNKLSVFMNRTNHLSFHLGQLRLVV